MTYRKAVLMLLWFSLAFSSSSTAQLPSAEFQDGKTASFSTRGHAKARGAAFTITYPRSWAASEGDRPTMVKRFVSENGKGLESIVILTKELAPEIPTSEANLKKLFSADGLKKLLPANAKFIRATPVEVAGNPAGILECSLHEVRAGLELDLHTLTLVFVQGRTVVQVGCQVGAASSKSSGLPARFAAFRPLFDLVLKSVEFEKPKSIPR